MREFLDTNLIVRYLTGEPENQALRACALIESETILEISPVVLAETSFVLQRNYSIDRERAIDVLQALLGRPNIQVSHVGSELALQALELCRPSGRVSVPDALLWAEAHAAGGVVHTFDKRFPNTGIEVRSP
jgi:predicted nucleic acid-binding protein